MPEDLKILVCAYCRVSSGKESQLNSLENQTYYFTEKTEQNGKYKLYEIYADEGLTATSWKKREHFKRMLYDAGLDIEIHRREIKAYVSNREPKFKRILIKDVSRFSRNASEGLELVTKLREKNVHIDFVSLGLSTEQMTNDMIIGFFLLAAENESKDKSQKVLWGKKIGAEKGVISTADKFYGYKYLKETNELKIIEHEAEVIRMIYDLYVNHGFGFRRILNHLEENKIYTRAGKPFVQQSIKRILSNPAYTGTLVRNKMDAPKVFTSKTYATLKPEEEWIITKNRIPKIIESNLLEKATIIRQNKLHYQQKVGKNPGISEYAGIIICSGCGSTYTQNKEVRTGRSYYNCGLKKKKGVKSCDNINVFNDQIEAAIEHMMNGGLNDALIKDRDTHISLINEKIHQFEKRINKQDVETIEELTKELNSLNEENKRLGILFIKAKIQEDILNEMQADLDEKIKKINIEINDVSMDNNQINKKIGVLEDVIKELRGIEIKEKYTKDEVKKQIKEIQISRNENRNNKPHLEMKFKIFETISSIITGQ